MSKLKKFLIGVLIIIFLGIVVFVTMNFGNNDSKDSIVKIKDGVFEEFDNAVEEAKNNQTVEYLNEDFNMKFRYPKRWDLKSNKVENDEEKGYNELIIVLGDNSFTLRIDVFTNDDINKIDDDLPEGLSFGFEQHGFKFEEGDYDCFESDIAIGDICVSSNGGYGFIDKIGTDIITGGKIKEYVEYNIFEAYNNKLYSNTTILQQSPKQPGNYYFKTYITYSFRASSNTGLEWLLYKQEIQNLLKSMDYISVVE